ncbi:hypothetical protein SLA2020_081120 [Shorea laevis]
MVSSIAELIEKLWDTWNFRGLIIPIKLLLLSFLILFAHLRSQRGGKWVVMIRIWMAYLLGDWVAIFTIGLMLRTESSDVLALWATLLLLHLGGPDTITSFSLEDNELLDQALTGAFVTSWFNCLYYPSITLKRQALAPNPPSLGCKDNQLCRVQPCFLSCKL